MPSYFSRHYSLAIEDSSQGGTHGVMHPVGWIREIWRRRPSAVRFVAHVLRRLCERLSILCLGRGFASDEDLVSSNSDDSYNRVSAIYTRRLRDSNPDQTAVARIRVTDYLSRMPPKATRFDPDGRIRTPETMPEVGSTDGQGESLPAAVLPPPHVDGSQQSNGPGEEQERTFPGLKHKILGKLRWFRSGRSNNRPVDADVDLEPGPIAVPVSRD
ncbi:hypothetical protein BJY04DRAFT_43274 [Aspergillus karnatakaensis]|uniref:uncharacterized protein n=1 Tax=Aspergillus karnatakaensis TaxID=1810916 RepID=UPI003CCD277A